MRSGRDRFPNGPAGAGGAENLTIATLVRAVGAELKLSFQTAAAHAAATANPASTPVSKVAEDPTPYRVTRTS